jgi:hypothetical protein
MLLSEEEEAWGEDGMDEEEGCLLCFTGERVGSKALR